MSFDERDVKDDYMSTMSYPTRGARHSVMAKDNSETALGHPTGQLSVQLGTLDREIDRMAKAVSVLTDRLQPFLLEDRDGPRASIDEQDSPGWVSPVSVEIRRKVDRLNYLNEELASLIERLDS